MQDFDRHYKKFNDFLNRINGDEKIAIVGHANCFDGVSSAVLMHEILRRRYPTLPKIEIYFITYAFGSIDNLGKLFREKEIKKAFFVDLGIDIGLLDEFNRLNDEFEVLLIDHHPINPKLDINEYVIKTISEDCTSLVIYEFGNKLFKFKDWEWLACAAAVSEFSWKSQDNLRIILQYDPSYSPYAENSALLDNVKKMNNLVNFYSKDSLKAYEIIIKKDFNKINEISKEVSAELNRLLEDFEKHSEKHFNNHLQFYFFKSKFSIGSNLGTALSIKHKGFTIVIFSEIEGTDMIKVSSRNNGEPLPYSMNDMCRTAIIGLSGAIAGGHNPASGASVHKKDLETFKKNIIEFVKSKIEHKN